MRLVRTRADYRQARAQQGGPCAVVMTMGALHDGHAALMVAARERVGPAGVVVATVFVNPLQFGAGEDFERYPRTLDADAETCERSGVDILLAPGADEVYPHPVAVTLDPGPLGTTLEGAARPGHFAGMLTVVAKLLHLTAPDIAMFGEKDYQQLVLVRAMVDGLDFPVEVAGVPTVREADGVAMSSRNRYLDAEQRRRASVIPRALRAAVARGAEGGSADDARQAALAVLGDSLVLDYLAVTAPDLDVAPAAGDARVLLAARLGSTRLLDNMALTVGGSP